MFHMFTTGHLPASMRLEDADAATLRAVQNSGLRLDTNRCEHGRYDCPACVIEAARRLVEAAPQGEPVC
jgi:hypothetical protein